MKIKRVRPAKPGELRVQYGKSDGEVDLFYINGGAGASSADARLACHFFENVTWPDKLNFRQELEQRGYDLSTLVFSIKQRVPDSASAEPTK